MPEHASDPLLVEMLKQLGEDVRAIRGAIDKDREDRHTAQVATNTQLTDHEGRLLAIEDARKKELELKASISEKANEQKVKLTIGFITALFTLLGGFVVWIVEQLLTHKHP